MNVPACLDAFILSPGHWKVNEIRSSNYSLKKRQSRTKILDCLFCDYFLLIEFKGQAFPEFMQKIIQAGGLVNYINKK